MHDLPSIHLVHHAALTGPCVASAYPVCETQQELGIGQRCLIQDNEQSMPENSLPPLAVTGREVS